MANDGTPLRDGWVVSNPWDIGVWMGRGPKGAIGLGGAGQGKAVPRLEARRWETGNEPSIADDIVEVSCTDNQSQPNSQNFLKRGKSTSDQVANLPMLEPNDQSSRGWHQKRSKKVSTSSTAKIGMSLGTI